MPPPQEPNGSKSAGPGDIRARAKERIGRWIRKKYRLDQVLGVGGMAAVYAATHRNGSRLAIKMLHADFANETSIRERFVREGYVANKVNHPGRVAIADDDETEEGEPFLVMELLEGQTLQQRWKQQNRRLDVVEALSVARAVLDTLSAFHDATIIHRDLKPANIFITHDKQVKLLDFGVAQLHEGGEAMTKAGSALGTPSYMSPEQAMGKSDSLDGRSDLYAVGATLYAVLSGKRLHFGLNDNESFILAATQPAPSLARVAPQLPIEVIALVDKALQWDRRNRFANAIAMRDACGELIAKLQGDQATIVASPAAQRADNDPSPASTPHSVESPHSADPATPASQTPGPVQQTIASSRTPPIPAEAAQEDGAAPPPPLSPVRLRKSSRRSSSSSSVLSPPFANTVAATRRPPTAWAPFTVR